MSLLIKLLPCTMFFNIKSQKYTKKAIIFSGIIRTVFILYLFFFCVQYFTVSFMKKGQMNIVTT